MSELKLDDSYIIHAYLVEKRSAIKISKELGCGIQVITKRLKKYGVELRNRSESIRHPLPTGFIIEAYTEERKSTHEIARLVGCSNDTISDRLKKNGISLRSKSEALVGRPRSEKVKARMAEISRERVGPKSFTWRGGKSFEPYCPAFNRPLKENIRNEFERKCFLCGSNGGKIKLHIHHIDYNKNSICNGKKWPLLPLCRSCHTKTNFNRHYWYHRLINYWALNPEINFYLF